MSWDMVMEGEAYGEEFEFHFNASSMPRYKKAMERLGMLAPTAQPSFPKLQDFGLTAEEARRFRESDPDLPDALREFYAADDRVRDWSEDDPAAIPSYKIGGTNDNWLVTPREIRAALAAYERRDKAERESATAGIDYWSKWIDFLRRAVDAGGFRAE